MPVRAWAHPRSPSRGGLAIVLAALALSAACAPKDEEGSPPRPTSVTPDRGFLIAPVAVRIEGQGFKAKVTTDFSEPAGGDVDARYRALLGAVQLQDVALRPDGSLTATVPAGLAAGTYDLTVVDPEGRAGSLAQAYSAVSLDASAALVAGFRVDPIGPQEAFRPFATTIAALDAAGEVVTEFNGRVSLADLTGTAVPGSPAHFVSGRWTGLVEIRAPHAADVLTVTGDGAAAGSSEPFAVAPPPAATVRFSTASLVATAGDCAGPVTLTLLDAFGLPAQAARSAALSLAPSPADGFSLFADPTCASAVGALGVDAGEDSVSFWFRATRAGSLDLAASGQGLATAAQSETVAPGEPAALAFTTPARTVAAGACSGVVTVVRRDVHGNPTPLGGPTIVALAAAPAAGFAFYSDASCSAPLSGSFAIAAGATAADFHFRGHTAGSFDVTAGASGLTATPAQGQTVTAAAPARLVFSTGAQSVTAGTCSGAVTVVRQDADGNPTPLGGASAVTPAAAPAAGFAFYSDSSCTTPLPGGFGFAADTTTASFFFRGTTAGIVDVTASASGLTGTPPQTETIPPAAPDRLVFTTGPQSVAAGSCSGAVTVARQDAYGNPTPLGGATAIALTAAPATGFAFYSDGSCATPLPGGFGFAPGATGAQIFFRGTVAGSVDVTSSASGLTATPPQTETIDPAPADRIVFATGAQAVAAGSCSSAVTVVRQDAHGNPSPLGGAIVITLGAAPAAGFGFYSDASCTTPLSASSGFAAGASSADFFFRGTAAGSVAVTASATGLTATPPQTETIDPAAPDRLVFSTGAQSVTAGSCSSLVTVVRQDPHGNPTSLGGAAAVAVSAAPAAGFAFFSDAACSTPLPATFGFAANAASADLYFMGTTAGSGQVTASAAGLAATPPQTETITPAAPARLVFATEAQSVTAGACSGAVTVLRQDAHGNPTPLGGAAAVALTAAPDAGFAFYSDASCTTPLPPTFGFAADATSTNLHFRGATAGTVDVTASAAGLTSALPQTETITPAAPDRLVFATGAQTVTAGSCSGAVTVVRRDAHGNPTSLGGAATLTLTAAPAAGFAFYSDGSCTTLLPASFGFAADATSASFHFRGTAAGTIDVTASAAGLTATAPQTETITAAAPVRLVFATGTQSVTAGSCSGAVTVVRQDAHGNPTPVGGAATVTLAAAPAAGFAFYSDSSCSIPLPGSFGFAADATSADLYFRGTTAGTVAVTASAAGLAATPPQTETIAPAAPDRLAFATSAQMVTAGACSGVVTVVRQDVHGNLTPLGGAAAIALGAAPATGFAFYSDAACSTPLTGTFGFAADVTNAAFYFRGTTAGSVDVTASASGLTTTPPQTAVITPAAPHHLVFSTSAQSVAAGACSAAVTVVRQDAHGNTTSLGGAAAIALAASPATGFAFYSDASCSTPLAGAFGFAASSSSADFYFTGTTAGSVDVTATAAGLAATPPQTETITPAAPDRLVIATGAQAVTAGACSGIVAVVRQDPHGNPTLLGGATAIALAASPNTGFAFYSDSSCSTPLTGAFGFAASSSTADFYFRGTTAGSVDVTASTAGLTATPAQTETITPAAPDHLVFATGAQSVAAGSCSSIVTIVRQDAHGNATPLGGALAITLAAAPDTSFAFYSDASCSTPLTGTFGLAADVTNAAFYFRGTTAGSVDVTANASGLTATPPQTETIDPAAPDRLVFSTGAQSVTAGSCSGIVTVVRQDPHGNPTTLGGAAIISLAAAPPTGFAFYSDASCSTPLTGTFGIAAGLTSASLYFAGTAAGAFDITAGAAGLTTTPPQTETVNPGPPTHLVFTSAPQTGLPDDAAPVTAGDCSAPVGLRSVDSYGNASTVTLGATVSLVSSASTGFTFYAGAGCSGSAVTSVDISAGASATIFSFIGTAAGPVTITADATSAGLLPSPAQDETIDPSAPDHLVFATTPQTVTAGSCSGLVTVVRRDSYGNPSPLGGPTILMLAAAPATGFTFYSDASCSTPLTADFGFTAGAAGADLYFEGTLAGSVDVTASAAGLTPTPGQTETIHAAGPTHLVFATVPQTGQQDEAPAVTAGACSAPVEVRSVDDYGNRAEITAPGGVTVLLGLLGATSVTLYSDALCALPVTPSFGIAETASGASFYFQSATTQSFTVTATGLGSSPAQAESIAAAAPAHLAFQTPARTVQAGGCSGAVTLSTEDQYGNVSGVAGATTVDLDDSSTGSDFYSDASCSDGSEIGSLALATGSSGASFYFKGTAAGTVTVTATASGLSSASQDETITPLPPDRLVFLAGAQTVTAGSCSGVVTVVRKDSYGNPSTLGGAATVSVAAAPSIGFAFYADPSCTTALPGSVGIADGTNSADFFFKGTAAGDVAVTATAAGLTATFQTETITAAAPDHLVFTTAPQTGQPGDAPAVTAGSCSAAVVLQSLDSYGNVSPVTTGALVALSASRASVSFHTTSNCTGATSSTVQIASGASTTSFYFTDKLLGDVTLTADTPGWSPPAAQVETIRALYKFAWDPIPSPQATILPVAVTVRALDWEGTLMTSFNRVATVTASTGAISCVDAMNYGSTCGAFSNGVWTGFVRGLPATEGAKLTAAYDYTDGITGLGSSDPFDVEAPPPRSPPVARFRIPTMVGYPFTHFSLFLLYGSSSSYIESTDYQTPAESLNLSWQIAATDYESSAPPGASPWVTWRNVQQPSDYLTDRGVYYPRLAVRDAEAGPGGPDVSYASTVLVIANTSDVCTVNTSSFADDGATSCASGGAGTDGALSLPEAVRLANAWAAASTPTIIFAPGPNATPLTITGAGVLSLTRPVNIVATRTRYATGGVDRTTLSTATLSIESPSVLIAGLQLANQSSPITIAAGAEAILRDVTIRDGAGVLVEGTAKLMDVRMANCTGTCVQVNDAASARLAVFHSDFQGNGAGTGIAFDACAPGDPNPAHVTSPYRDLTGPGSAFVGSTVFTGFDTAVRSSCPNTWVANDTFVGNATGVSGVGYALTDSIFSGHDIAVDATVCPGFATQARQLVWQNTSDGCLAHDISAPPSPDGTFSADPLFIYPIVRDYRIQYESPAKDWGDPGGTIDLNDAGPGLFLGAGPDRGARETY